MAKKRAPGAGRKPRGEFKGKSATLTTRITPGHGGNGARGAKEWPFTIARGGAPAQGFRPK